MRTCIICKTKKDKKAFIGYREVCRTCWYYLTKEEKSAYIAKARERSIYYFNKMAWEREKALNPKPKLNFKIIN